MKEREEGERKKSEWRKEDGMTWDVVVGKVVLVMVCRMLVEIR